MFELLQVQMYLVVTLAYIIFWGPLFTVSSSLSFLSTQVTLINWQWTFEDAKKSMAHEVKLRDYNKEEQFL